MPLPFTTKFRGDSDLNVLMHVLNCHIYVSHKPYNIHVANPIKLNKQNSSVALYVVYLTVIMYSVSLQIKVIIKKDQLFGITQLYLSNNG